MAITKKSSILHLSCQTMLASQTGITPGVCFPVLRKRFCNRLLCIVCHLSLLPAKYAPPSISAPVIVTKTKFRREIVKHEKYVIYYKYFISPTPLGQFESCAPLGGGGGYRPLCDLRACGQLSICKLNLMALYINFRMRVTILPKEYSLWYG